MQENTNFSRLPLGCKFCPSDKQLLGFFLYIKITRALPPRYDTLIQECYLYGELEPWQIWEFYRGEDNKDDDDDEKEEEDMYFITQLKKKSINGSRINRKLGGGGGAWQSEDAAKKVPPEKSKARQLGFKKRFRYENRGKHDGAWIMHKYSLDPSLLESHQANDYVLCRIWKNANVLGEKRNRQEEEKQVINARNDKVNHQVVSSPIYTHLLFSLMKKQTSSWL